MDDRVPSRKPHFHIYFQYILYDLAAASRVRNMFRRLFRFDSYAMLLNLGKQTYALYTDDELTGVKDENCCIRRCVRLVAFHLFDIALPYRVLRQFRTIPFYLSPFSTSKLLPVVFVSLVLHYLISSFSFPPFSNKVAVKVFIDEFTIELFIFSKTRPHITNC